MRIIYRRTSMATPDSGVRLPLLDTYLDAVEEYRRLCSLGAINHTVTEGENYLEISDMLSLRLRDLFRRMLQGRLERTLEILDGKYRIHLQRGLTSDGFGIIEIFEEESPNHYRRLLTHLDFRLRAPGLLRCDGDSCDRDKISALLLAHLSNPEQFPLR